MKNLRKRLECWFSGGHKRGKRISDTHVECPHCGTTWVRKKAKAVAA